MANKSFVVQYIIKAREQYVATSEKVRVASERVRKTIERTKKATAGLSAKSVILKNKLRPVPPTMGALSAKSATLEDRLRALTPTMRGLSAKSVILKGKLRALSPAMMSLNSHGLRLKRTLKGLEDRFEGVIFVGRKLRNVGAGMTAALTLPIALASRALKNAARDAEETRSKFKEVYKGINKEAEGVADTFAKSFGLAGSTARDLLGNTGDLLTGLGLTRKEALDLSLEMNTLASDMASFKNFQGGATAASSAMLRAMVGEREAMKGLGIAITEQMVKREMAMLAQKGTTARSLEHLKVLATMVIITKKAKNSVGDFTRTQKELANQERITAERTKLLAEMYGALLVPALAKAHTVIRKVMDVLIGLSPGTKKAILVIGAILAVLGPLLLILGALIMALPMLAAGFAGLGVVLMLAAGPVGAFIALLAAGAYLIMDNWEKVSTFFKAFGADVRTIFDGIKATFLRSLGGLGKLITAIVTMDFSKFGLDDVKAEFLGAQAAPVLTQSRVDVGVNVGLDKGLKQTSAASVAGAGMRRGDVGMAVQ